MLRWKENFKLDRKNSSIWWYELDSSGSGCFSPGQLWKWKPFKCTFSIRGGKFLGYL